MEAGGDGFNEPGRGEYTEENKDRGAESEESGNRTGGFACFFLVVAGKKIGVDGDEGSRKDALTKEILQEVWNSQGGFEDVGSVGIAKVVGKNTIADESGDTAEENPGSNEESKAFGAGGLGFSSGRFGHKSFQASISSGLKFSLNASSRAPLILCPPN